MPLSPLERAQIKSPPPGSRDGLTFDKAKDERRLNRQAQAVWNLMRDGIWRTLSEISHATQEPEASISARLRDFRKARFNSNQVLRRRRGKESRGVWEYKLVPRA